MFDQARSFLGSEKHRNVAMTAGGLIALLGGRKVVALSLLATGLAGLEKTWRREHPDFTGDLSERWQRALDHYDANHKHPVNRQLHTVGIPFIVSGAFGLLVYPPYRPLWGLSAAAFVGGWVLNFIGHGRYEKNAPAFADDPLSFVAGPVWDFRRLFGKRKDGAPETGDRGRPDVASA